MLVFFDKILYHKLEVIMGVKIKVVKSVNEVKGVHAFIAEQLKLSIRAGEYENFPLVETYGEMMDAVSVQSPLQIKAELSGVLIGHALAVIDDVTKSAWLRIIMVKRYFQKKGIAQMLLKNIEKTVKKLGFDTLKTLEREGANGFYIRSGFVPFLYVTCKNLDEAKKALEFNAGRLKLLSNEETPTGVILKFDAEEEAVYSDKKMFNKLSKGISANYVYEKKLK